MSKHSIACFDVKHSILLHVWAPNFAMNTCKSTLWPFLTTNRRVEAMVHAQQGAWKQMPLSGAVPSHRQSLALCGAPGRSEKVVLFGGNTSRRVAGNWRLGEDL